MKDLKGKVAAITGAGSGIGRALAQRLAEEGAHLALSDVNPAGLAETRALLEGKGVKVTTHEVNVADRAAVHAWADAAAADHGGVDLIFNNAGVVVFDTLENISYENFEFCFNVIFWGVVYGTKAFLPHLRKRPEGHIINISSINAMMPFPYNGPYNSGKGAVRLFNLTLIQELRGTNIHVTSVHPGGIKTNIARSARFIAQPGKDYTNDQLGEMFDKVASNTADDAARKIIGGVKRDKEHLLVGADAHLLYLFSRLAPALTARIAAFIYEKSGD